MAVCTSLLWLGCGSTSNAEAVTVQFRAEEDLLSGFAQDSGFVPSNSPAAIRVVADARARLLATAAATASGTQLTPVPGSGSLALDAGFSLEVSARVDAAGFEYEGVVETFEYAVDPTNLAFDPFAIDAPVVLSSAFPPGELATVPIPSIPGATLLVTVSGGAMETTFTGICAASDMGAAQYTAQAVIEGTLELAGTVVIEIPIVGPESFGPFPVGVPIPPASILLDLGSFSTTDAMRVDLRPCDALPDETDGSSATSGMPSDPTLADDDTTTGPETTSAGPSTATTTTTTTSATSETGETGPQGTTGEPEDTDEACNDDLDNDGDGQTDCEDEGCWESTYCTPCGASTSCRLFDEECVDAACVPVPLTCANGDDCESCPGRDSCGSCVEYEGQPCRDAFLDCLSTPGCLEIINCQAECDGEPECENACTQSAEEFAAAAFFSLEACVDMACG